MLIYARNRLLALPIFVFVIYFFTVVLISQAPGEVFAAGEKELPPEVLAEKLKAYNYDQSFWQRYFWTWPYRLLVTGDLPAHQYPDWTVREIMGDALPVSLQLGTFALTFAVLLGIAAGLIAARFPHGWVDRCSLGLTLIGISLPTFVTGAALLIVAGLWLRVVPVGGWGQVSQIFLPALTLALPYAAYIARLTRAGLLDAMQEDYARTARAKGLSEQAVLMEHALKNALLPVLSYLGPAAAAIFTGSFVVERIFAIPGMGTHVVESINNRDQTLILATVLIYSVFLIGFNLIVDLLYAVLDPRIRVGAASG